MQQYERDGPVIIEDVDALESAFLDLYCEYEKRAMFAYMRNVHKF